MHVGEPSSYLPPDVAPSSLNLSSSSMSGRARAKADTRPPLPNTRQIMSGPRTPGAGFPAAEEDRWRVVDEVLAKGELGKRATYLRGVTVSLLCETLADSEGLSASIGAGAEVNGAAGSEDSVI
jgi:hypothetical protein